MMTWMRRRGDRVTITTGKLIGHQGTVESNVYQRTVDFPDEWFNGHHIMLDTEELVTVRWEQVERHCQSRSVKRNKWCMPRH